MLQASKDIKVNVFFYGTSHWNWKETRTGTLQKVYLKLATRFRGGNSHRRATNTNWERKRSYRIKRKIQGWFIILLSKRERDKWIDIYFALVRSNLEFAALIWNPHTTNNVKAIKQIQKRFLKYLYYKTFDYYPIEIPYEELLRDFEVEFLESKRMVASLFFLYDMLKGTVTDPNLLSKINLNVFRACSRRIHSGMQNIEQTC